MKTHLLITLLAMLISCGQAEQTEPPSQTPVLPAESNDSDNINRGMHFA